MIENRMLARMQEGQTALGLGATMPPASHMPVFVARAGFDWAFLDLEHALISPENLGLLCTMLRLQGVTPLVRIASGSLDRVASLLDSGAQGIILPHVETAREAQDLVALCKYAPTGRRSWGGASPQLGYPQKPSAELMSAADATTLAIVMCESRSGVDNIDQIAAVPGLDGVLIGNVDLSLDLGETGAPDGPATTEAILHVGRAVNAAGRHFGIAGAPSPERIRALQGLRIDFLLAGMDHRIFAAALEARAETWRSALGSA
ncbi:hypothetical protein GE300_14250 [Rhodobacteraceae bacterium 2CG4]|uniref:HpcH/HpaI aldolase/citrate lyase domain-containing protein n=1 Tax=Halovulum marinum TaxID=2662447 RepID=A0A6L5Z2F5_9RHOB|nr:aldolase/citrate lyase family protein [Halovulum marinum]MSU90761.1 hypothetical protein [Halovulum marinum]